MKMSPPESVLIEHLKPDANNSRLHPSDNLEAIKASLMRFGQPEVLVARRDSGVVIAGNGRLLAMRELGWHRADVRWVDCSDDEAKAYALTANRTSEMAKWDSEQLQGTLDELAGTEFNMDDFGFPDDFLDSMDAERPAYDIDEPQALEQRPKLGAAIRLTEEQREVFDRACERVREDSGENYSEGRCLELMAADYMSG